MKTSKDKLKICIVSNTGGHLTHMYLLKPFWEKHDRIWVTCDREDTRGLLVDEKIYACHYPFNKSVIAVLHNAVIALKVMIREKPDLILSAGASVAVPFFYIGKLFRCKLIYVEVFDRIDKSTTTGKLIYPIADLFCVQWEEQLKVYPKAVNLGSIF